ncbi:uncharacterized protein LOC125221287 [Salvia hispanica]|uniref:uncharacterized protein LOC125221281 n=1 Tax=Salvia hispanica TaxID=49212 RepID=UPI002009D281|nr:uncharacterized protein LOC125221281 [Salvia hispanica]XP_047979366.1 uncharacterized protein LOC125221287 [Salvia hispanica]
MAEDRVPVRASYVNLYKWPESDLDFVRSFKSKSRSGHRRALDSISCRQLYLRSYPLSREEDNHDTASFNCLGRGNKARKKNVKKAKSTTCSALAYIFRRLLSCTTDVDVAN